MRAAGHLSGAFSGAATLLLLCYIQLIRCQSGGAAPEFNNASTSAVPYFTQVVYDRFASLSSTLVVEISQQLGFCIKNPNTDWNGAFNFSSDLGFLSDCITDTDGDLTQRLCTAAEIKFYFSSFFIDGGNSNFLRPNINCNLTSWVSGCEPGWACSVGEDQNIHLKDSINVPSRNQSCRPCCEGFFCPHGLTCMIPCPLGAYCPRAQLNTSTGVCDPYNYQPPPGQTNHTCGGADRWSDVGTSGEVFCPAGYFCPSTVRRVSCSSGYYCRKGSTSENRCFRKSSCKPNSSSQNITIFGVLLMVALSLVLLIIFNFSGHILTSRERRQAKSREAAARSARETAKARERWKAAKDLTKKHALELQSQLSRSLSRKRSLKISAQDTSDVPLKQSKPSTSKDKEPISANQVIHSIEDYPESSGDFHVQMGDKNSKKDSKGKEMHTRSQIFKYAYGQIEKEKAMQQKTNNLTFSGVLSMATDIERRNRPVIEVAFKNLTLTLKGSKKQLLKSVTGKIMPGRVTAVMGPSGAGKTTFLSALTGKTLGCDVSGSVLINGKAESIRSYKKIIGFVPQDDIVHGNLTVEENLWFSAKCRLSADMPKAHKVLVVERVIESLGLQHVRDCLVGTVEKRGISGGQRKRVNVGLEMVMEPSLLILDEPTSGLDSASSQLLLRALRREAHEGVNICVVVHQPSYILFKMFDDLVLLAKGGLIVYLGAVNKVEDYFSGLGIDVPERVNPPDYFIDILEGIVQPPEINVRQLPLRWMQLNGHDVPHDMLQNINAVDKGSEANEPIGSKEESAAGVVLITMTDALEKRREHLKYSLSKAKDLSNRTTPGVLQQYKYFLGRVGKQRLREARIQGVDFLILGLAGVCLGILAKVNDESFGASGYTYTVIAVSLLCKIGALRSFSLEKLQYWRERSSGMSSLAYFLSKDTIDHFNTLVKPIVYLSMFYFFNNPRSSILDNYAVLVALVYCVTGIGYLFAICFQPGSAQLWSALVPVVLTLLVTQRRDSKLLCNLCYTKWALEGFVIANAERYSGVWLITRCGSLMKFGYNIHDWALCVIVLFAYGLAARCLAFFFMVFFTKK